MKRIFLLTILLALCASAVPAQQAARYGLVARTALIEAQPEYAEARSALATLRHQYAQEAEYNEQNFKRQFAEYLEGQKDFPRNIMLKRQRDLQEELEKGLAFRSASDSLLRAAEAELFAPVAERVDSAIRAVALERGLEAVFDSGDKACLFVHPSLAEDITAYVEERLLRPIDE